ncbi:MAG: transketolase C-terminal domain-containing protein [Desulfosarcinaceae bacterium]|jgi:2-oxoglutarate ferredoxin oxidoreductase subunit alpha
MELTLMEGNEAIGLGAVAAGCNFFAGYPITPATTIYNTMLKLLPPKGGVCLQGEDEIASIGFCLGAAMAGMKTMTATSGPGISLYSEQISFAIGSEIPIVIVDVQRLGPSTGSATKGADGDIQFLRWGNSGGLPVIVLAPVDVKDCFELTAQAFNLAEQYRCPVFVAANKEISMTRETFSLDELSLPAVVDRRQADGETPFVPFGVGEGRHVPDFLPIGGKRLVRQTSSTHGVNGYITTDPEEIAMLQRRLKEKLTRSIAAFTYFDEIDTPGAETLVVAYGVTARAAKIAVRRLKERGQFASLLVLKTLWPVPEDLIREKAAPYQRVVMAEMNLGQYVRELERLLPDKQTAFVGQMNGELIKPAQIMDTIMEEASNG